MAEFVPDLALQQAPVESMAALRGDAKKEADELSVFREFTKRSCVTLRMKLVHERKRVMGLAVVLVPLGGLIAFGPSLEVALLLAALVAFSHLTWQVTMGALIVDTWPQRTVATVFGLIAAGSGFGGLLSTDVIGRLVST